MELNKVLLGLLKVAFGITVILLLIYAGVRLSAVGYDFGYRVFTEPAMTSGEGRDVIVQVYEDGSARDLAKSLEDKGLVRDSNLFYLQYKLSAYSGKLVPGIYTLNTSMTSKDMIVLMSTPVESETESTESEQESK